MNAVFRDKKDPIGKIIGRGGSVLVVGLGSSGLSAANLLARAGCRVEVSEKKRRSECSLDLSLLEPSVRVHWGGHPWEHFEGRDLVVVSPGVPEDMEPLPDAKLEGIPVIGELELAFRMTTVPWAAVTGSNGKSTTVTLLNHMAREGGIKAATGGNLGTPATSFVEGIKGIELVIVEVSSFQLETVDRFKPSVGALLNVSPDHLDRYPGMDQYIAAKARLFMRMDRSDWAVFNADDPETVRIAGGARATPFPFGRLAEQKRGVFLKGDWITIRDENGDRRILRSSEVALPGVHNLENAMAAVAVASKVGISDTAMTSALKAFKGLEHRMELVGYFRGVAIYNDSKGTNVGATLRSLEGLGNHVVLILGGKDKGTSYDPLKEPIRRKVSRLILLGEAAGRMEAAFRGAAQIIKVDNLEEAVRVAIQSARPGNEILFSPACSSFDMFSSYEERGKAFKKAARKYLGMIQ